MATRESFVADRIARIDAAIEARNALLHQLYDLIRNRYNDTILTGGESEKDDEGLALFKEKLDIRKDPNMGIISQFTNDELHAAVLSTITTSDTPQSLPNTPALPTPPPATPQAATDTIAIASPSVAPSNVPVDTEMADVIVVPTLPTSLIPISTPVEEPKNLANGTLPNVPTDENQGHSQPAAPETSVSTAMDVDQDDNHAQMPSQTPVQVSTNGVTTKGSPPSPHPVTGTAAPAISTPVQSTHVASSDTSTPAMAISGGLEDPRFDIIGAYKEPIVPKYEPNYTLPLLSTLPVEFKAKGASRAARQQKKKEKEREKQAAANGAPIQETVKKEKIEEFVPLGMNRWGAVIRSNPAFKKVSTATKSLTTKDWNVAMMELSVLKALERIEELKDGKWSFRQPKKQRGVGGLTKTHGDYLLDEMKWMRTDFREERKWKIAMAYTLGQSVLEWHSAVTPEERLRRGICVFWKKPRTPSDNPSELDTAATQDRDTFPEGSALAMVNYESENDEDDDDGEQEKEEETKESAGDALEADLASAAKENLQDDSLFQVKQEDIEQHVQANEDAMAIDEGTTSPSNGASAPPATDALQVDSLNPMLVASGSTLEDGDPAPMNAPKPGSAEAMAYNAIRENVAYSSELKLFLDDSDVALCLDGFSNLSLEPSIADIFADLQPYSMLDSPVPMGEAEKKKGEKRSERADPYKRTEDTTFSKLTPVVKMMHCKPTLLGPLQPARRWKGGKWINIDDGPLPGDYEKPSIKTEDVMSDLFDPHLHRQYTQLALPVPRRPREHEWTTQDDALLKSLVEKYSPNWSLIAECYNSMKPSVKSDRRWSSECKHRWETQLSGRKEGQKPLEPAPSLSLSPSLSTRGTKRQAEISAASAASNIISGESKKRRRHLLVADTVRKTAKKRESSNKASLNPRKSSGLHETHNQYASLRPITPSELSAKKQEREELLKRQELERRNQIMAQRMGSMPVAMAANSVQLAAARQGLPNGQTIPQIRTSQVNISQQQRIATPASVAAAAAARLASPLNAQQARAMQAMANHPQAQAQAFAVQQQAAAANGMANHHLSPQSVPRDSTSSPTIIPAVAAQASPPRTSATPSNSSPIPLPAQVNNIAGTPARPASVAGMNAYYPIMQTQYTPEQYMRILQHAQQQQQLAHQQQVAQQAQALQSSPSGQS